jgi:hypothetical protein
MLREAFRVLRPGGVFFIYTPNPAHVIERLKARNWILKQNPTHVDLKSKGRIVSTLETVGFCIQEAYSVASFFPVLSLIERLMMSWPVVGPLFCYRTCVSAVKPG